MSRALKIFLSNVVEISRKANPKTVLDVGCGEGFVVASLSEAGVGGFIVGFDTSLDAIKNAKKTNPDKIFVVADANKIPFSDSSFDLVLGCEILEHVDSPLQVVDECRRVSKKSLLFSVPNKIIFRIANMFRLKNLFRFGEDRDHRHAWTKNQFVELISKKIRLDGVRGVVVWTLTYGFK